MPPDVSGGRWRTASCCTAWLRLTEPQTVPPACRSPKSNARPPITDSAGVLCVAHGIALCTVVSVCPGTAPATESRVAIADRPGWLITIGSPLASRPLAKLGTSKSGSRRRRGIQPISAAASAVSDRSKQAARRWQSRPWRACPACIDHATRRHGDIPPASSSRNDGAQGSPCRHPRLRRASAAMQPRCKLPAGHQPVQLRRPDPGRRTRTLIDASLRR